MMGIPTQDSLGSGKFKRLTTQLRAVGIHVADVGLRESKAEERMLGVSARNPEVQNPKP